MLAALLLVAQMVLAFPGGTCPPDYFCSPTVGIYGEIVPYADTTGQEPLGSGIRSLPIGPGATWLVGHAYTQFWAITMLKAGEVVYANGVGFRVQQAYTQFSCVGPARPPAELSLQTSLDSEPCGLVYVVQLSRE